MHQQRFSVPLVMIGVLALVTSSTLADTIYVDVDATGQNDGSSWTDAYTDLQDALPDCGSGDEIWVAEGTYTPDDCNPSCVRTMSFALVDGCKMYGGFAGTESNKDDRAPATNVTILSGDNNHDDDSSYSDNAYHVITVPSNAGSTTVVDGFTITKGYADGTLTAGDGGGINITLGGDPTFEDCIITDNYGVRNGGALYYYGGDGAFNECTFSDNHCDGDGGAIYLWDADPTFTDCIFTDNDTDADGGAFYNTGGSDPTVDRSKFSDNEAVDLGGAICNASGSPTLTNCLFHDNAATRPSLGKGGAIYNGASNPRIENCTIAENTATSQGGGIYNGGYGGSSPTIVNTILWGNSDAGGSDESGNMHTALGSPSVTYTDWQGHTGGTGNVNEDPHFTPSYYPQNPTHAINGGKNNEVNTDYDLAGNDRITNVYVDMGALEVRFIYVDADATAGNNDGMSWTDAYLDLQDALDEAEEGFEIWVAEGTYTPDDCSPSCVRTSTFYLAKDVGVFGGFYGTENDFFTRHVTTNETILSGDNGGDDGTSHADDAYHVVGIQQNSSKSTRLDGFTVMAGYADGLQTAGDGPAIMVPLPSYATVADCTIADNYGLRYGGAVHCAGGELTFTGCTLSNNETDGEGGAIHLWGCDATLVDCVLDSNTAEEDGGAIYTTSADIFGDRCAFHHNVAGLNGGAVLITGDDTILTNCLFHSNEAAGTSPSGNGGAVLITSAADPTLTNCTIARNTAATYGGGIYNSSLLGGCDPVIKNCILWDNVIDGQEPGETSNMYSAGLSTPVVTYTDWQGHTPDDGNIDEDPDFVDPDNGDFHLAEGSPCIDRGDPDYDPGSADQDIDGDDRIQQCCVDMGSDETPYLGVQEPDPETDGCDKNRYISFEPNNGTREVAFRVTLYDTTLGQDFEDLEGEEWWVQTPDVNGIARLGCTAVYLDWSDDTVVHVGDDEIFPESDYDIQAVQELGEEDEDLYSDALRVSTVDDWGDVVGAKDQSGVWTCPDGVVNMNDINAVLEAYQGAQSAPPLVQADIDPAVPNKVVNMSDLARVIAAFETGTYPFDAPDPCE